MPSSRVAAVTSGEWATCLRSPTRTVQVSRLTQAIYHVRYLFANNGPRVRRNPIPSWGAIGSMELFRHLLSSAPAGVQPRLGIFQDGTGRAFGSARACRCRFWRVPALAVDWQWNVNHERASKFGRSAYRMAFSARQSEFRTRPTHSPLLWFRSVSCRSLNRLFWSGFG
jgi:hypothetical protein